MVKTERMGTERREKKCVSSGNAGAQEFTQATRSNQNPWLIDRHHHFKE